MVFSLLTVAFNFLAICAGLYSIKLLTDNVTIINLFLVCTMASFINITLILTHIKIIRRLVK